MQDFFYGNVMSSRVSGRAFIPHNRNVIVAANHASHLDMGFVRHALGTYGEDIVTLAAQDYFFEKNTIQRAFFENLTNLRAIDRKSGLRASERQAGELLQKGKTTLIFPEGTRSTDGQVHEFKPLLGHLALTYGVDILPVYLGGTREAMPKGGKLPTSREIVARIGPPIRVTDMRRLTKGLSPADAAREVAKLAHRAVVALQEGKLLDPARIDEPGRGRGAEGAPARHALRGARRQVPARSGRQAGVVLLHARQRRSRQVDRARLEGQAARSSPESPMAARPTAFSRRARRSSPRSSVTPTRPARAEFLSGAIKSNDVGLLMTFQKVFQLGG